MTEIFTRLTPESLLVPVFEELGVDLVICGHAHMQFDRTIARIRVVNAGSVGMPFGSPGADWAEFAEQCVLHTPPEAAMLETFTNASFR